MENPRFAYPLKTACANYLNRAETRFKNHSPNDFVRYQLREAGNESDEALLEHFMSWSPNLSTGLLARIVVDNHPVAKRWPGLHLRQALYTSSQAGEHYLIQNAIEQDGQLDLKNIRAHQTLQTELQATQPDENGVVVPNPLDIIGWKNLKAFRTPGMSIEDATNACIKQQQIMVRRATLLEGDPRAESTEKIAEAYAKAARRLARTLKDLEKAVTDA